MRPLSFQIYHDGEGSITAVAAAVVLTDIPPGPIEGSSAASSAQQFSVEFQLDPNSDAFSEMTRSQDLGNLVDRERSGNPGYLPGLAVLAGRLGPSGTFSFLVFAFRPTAVEITYPLAHGMSGFRQSVPPVLDRRPRGGGKGECFLSNFVSRREASAAVVCA